jgi:hypothetical protein
VATWQVYKVGYLPMDDPGPSDKFKPTKDKVINKTNNATMKRNLLAMLRMHRTCVTWHVRASMFALVEEEVEVAVYGVMVVALECCH